MKTKAILIGLAIGLCSITTAQDAENDVLTNAKGDAILPADGDWALGFDASPLLNYAGNMFNGNTGNTLNAAWDNSNAAITGKYFKDATTAYRASLRIGIGSSSVSTLVDTSAAQIGEYIENVNSTTGTAIVIGGGMELRRGHGKVQGYYGGEALITLGGSGTSDTYGLDLSDANPFSRSVSSKTGSIFGFTLRGFVGVEYFIMPKISIGAEYGWGLGFQSIGEGSATTESWDMVDSQVVSTTTTTGGSSAFVFDNDNSGGAIRLLFHF
jgi:hypothetical protein